MEATMLPSQKRKALAPPDSPPRTKSSRAVAAAPGLPAEPSASSRDVGSVRAAPLGSPDGPPGLRADRDVKDEGSREWQNADEACPRPPDHRTEGSAGETAVGLPGVNRDPWLAGVPFSSSQSPEADPVVTGAPTAQSPPGPSQPPAHAATATPPSRSDRGGLWPREVCTGTPSDEEKDEGERNLVITVEEGESANKKRAKKAPRREKKSREGKGAEEVRPDCNIQLDDSFERALEDGAKQHNLTAINVRNILHEVITNEHVVAMMKAAMFDTEQPHLFEPKMTRSKLKEVVEKGVVPPTWNLSPIKSKESKAPQFIDIPLEEEDSSDEEYRPEEEEEEEDETAEESFMESDAESTSSSPAGGGRPRSRQEVLETEEESSSAEVPGVAGKEGGPPGVTARHLSVETVPMGPPPLPPKAKHRQNQDTSFMEKLHAVDEELASNEVCMDSYQSLNECLIAYRTRSKWPLNNVSLGLLEAELKAPDITADMYDQGGQDDVYWQNWMNALMNDLDYEDDEDDPEYNFLEDLDEPDMEDFRNDRAVQITKKEVNELMEELFETFQDEMGVLEVEEEGGDDDAPQEQVHNTFNTPQAIRFEEPLANILNEQHRTVKAQIEQLRQRKARQQGSLPDSKGPSRRSQQPDTLFLGQQQKQQLQQQMQQHVQLLTQVHLLTSVNPRLQQEAATSRLFLKELDSFSEKARELYSARELDFSSMFAPCNLAEALALIEEFDSTIKPHVKIPPRRDDQKMNRRFDESNQLPKEVAWIVATRSVFLYPELLPQTALQPRHPKDKAWFSPGEDNLLVLGLKHFEDTDFPKPLISQYLMPPKTYHQLSVRIKNLTVSRAPDNVIKIFKKRKLVLPMPSRCVAVSPEDRKPPVDREESKLPYWLQRSLPAIHQWLELRKVEARARVEEAAGGSEKDPELPEGEVGCSRCPPAAPLQIPDGVTLLVKPRLGHLTKRELRRCKRRPSATKPVLIHPAVKRTPCKQPGPLLPPQPGARPPPRLIQPAPSVPFPPQPQAVPTLAPARPCPSPRLCGGSSGRKPRGRRPGRGEGRGRRGGPRPAIVPVTVQQAPVILTVPAGVKLLSLPAAGSVLDVASGHTLRLATMIVSQPAFTCPLPRPPASGDGEPGSGACSTLRAEAGQREEPAVKVGCPGPQLVNGALGSVPDQPAVKTEPAEGTDPGNPQESAVPEQPPPQVPLAPDSPPRDQGAPGTSDKQQVLLRLGEELDVGSPLESVSRQPPVPEKAEPGAAEASPGEERCQELLETSRDGTEDTAPSPEDLKSLLDKVDKDGPEEEEEDDDFDDLTEDEEVLSSASEESALSVPELQETMQKLTWLASERRISQEADSEEENSQEENSEPDEEEEEGDGLDLKGADGLLQEMADKEGRTLGFPTARDQIRAGGCLPGEGRKLCEKGKPCSRARVKRGRRRRISKDTSKLLLLYDEDILNNDPLREQKDMAFAQAYLTKVREALQDVPGKYEEFLRILYDFETNPDQRTAVDLYGDLCDIIQEWPQLLKDFAAFLLPEQALQCGLFEEQQAFDKSRKFLRQLEICFAENPTHYQKIIKALQCCMVCSPPDVAELKVQVWQLLKGHHHLQDEFSLFFDSLRPPSSRMSDFEEVNWTEDKEYEFDGFEEVVLPDLEDEEEIQKMAPLPRNKKRRECHPHEKSLDSKSSKGKDSGNVLEAWSPQPGNKDPGKAGDLVEDDLEQKEDPHTPDPSKAELAVSAGASGRRPCLPPAACEEGQTWGSVLSPGPDHSMSEGDEIESAASRFRMETPSSLVGSTNETCGLPAEGEGGNSSTQRGEGGEEEADRGGVMRHTAAEGAPGSRENTSRSQGGDWARLRPQAPTTKDQERRVAATRDQSHQEVGTLGEGVSWRAEEEGSPGSASLQPGGHASVKFASASAQVRFQSCQKLSDLSPIDLRLTLARRALPDRSFQSSREDETALGTSARESPAVSLALGPSSENSPLQAESDEHYSQAQAAVCAQNTRLSSTGERVVLWTREADRAILTACRESGANEETFREVAQQLNSKSAQEVSQRFRELMWLFHTSGDASTDEEEDIMSSSNPEQLSDRPVSDEEQD